MITKPFALPRRALVVFGTRPEAIKLAPLVRALQKDPRYKVSTVFTGQHADMVKPILDWFEITPDYTLNVMAHKQPLAHLSGKLLYGLHTIMEKERPDVVFVQGDTTTAFIAGLTAYYAYDYYVRTDAPRMKVDIAHVEAGLRTYDNYAPFPEEINRKLIGHMATHHFAPTLTAATALYDENITGNVFVTGNTGIDALFDTVSLLQQNPQNPLPQMPLDQEFVLITGHRRENYGDGFNNICKALRTLAERFPRMHFVYPVHLNRHVQDVVRTHLDGIGNILLTDPLDYPQFIALMQRAKLVLTDSGGLQEEAPSLGKPVLVMRDVTERPDAVLAGTAKMVGTDPEKLIKEVSTLLTDDIAYKTMADACNPYGDGHACKRILNIMAGGSAEENSFDTLAA